MFLKKETKNEHGTIDLSFIEKTRTTIGQTWNYKDKNDMKYSNFGIGNKEAPFKGKRT